MTIIQTNKPLAKRRKFDFYPTPRAFCDKALALLDLNFLNVFREGYKPALHVLDPGCGTGVWGQAALKLWADRFNVIVDGCEIRGIEKPEGYQYLYNCDFRLLDHGLEYDLVIGNPPFIYGESFVRVGLANLKEDGLLMYLLPLRFLEGKARARGLFRKTPPKEVYSVGRVSFTANGRSDDTAYALYVWQKDWMGETTLKWAL
jgi:hypothetical protein